MIKQDSFILIWMEDVSVSSNMEKISLRIDAGEYVNIRGLHGSDKASLLNVLSCLFKPISGKYIYDYHDIATLSEDKLGMIRCKIGFLFRSLHIIDQLNVYENIQLPFSSRTEDARHKVESAARRLGIEELLPRMPNALSDLEKHKIALARALVVGPALIIADEPTEGLDENNAEGLLRMMREINANGTTIISISEKVQVQREADRHIVFDKGHIISDSRPLGIKEGVI